MSLCDALNLVSILREFEKIPQSFSLCQICILNEMKKLVKLSLTFKKFVLVSTKYILYCFQYFMIVVLKTKFIGMNAFFFLSYLQAPK